MSQEQAIRELLSHLPLLRAGNHEAKVEFLKILPKVLSYCIQNGVYIEESRQLLSYSLIHPAIGGDERSQFTLWLSKLEESCGAVNNNSINHNRYQQLASSAHQHHLAMDPKLGYIDMDLYPFTRPLGQVAGWDCAGSHDSGIVANSSPESTTSSSLSLNVFPLKSTAECPRQNGFTPLHSTLSAPPALQSVNTSPSKYP